MTEQKCCRYRQRSVIPPYQLPQHPRGPAIWQVQDASELVQAVELLVNEPLQRRSQGNAAVQAAARIANGMLTVAWEVLVIMVMEPALAGVPPKAVRADMPDQGTNPAQAGHSDGGAGGSGGEIVDGGEGGDHHDDGDGGNSAHNSPTGQGTSLQHAGRGDNDSHNGGTLDECPTSPDA